MVGIWLEVMNARSEANFLGERSQLYVQLKGDSSDRPLAWWRVQTDLSPKTDGQEGDEEKPDDESTKNRTILDLAKRVEDALKDKRVVLARLRSAPDGLLDDDEDYENSVKKTGLIVDRIRIQFSDTTTTTR